MESKKCSQCRETLPIGEFHKDRSSKDGFQRRCKACHRKHAALWWERNGKKSYQKHKEYQREWRKKNPERYAARERRYWMRKKYAMTEADFQALLVKQGGKCAICCEEAELVIDHCHARGKVRELLCQPCNKGLGCFFDSPEKLRLAIAYLERHAAEE